MVYKFLNIMSLNQDVKLLNILYLNELHTKLWQLFLRLKNCHD